MRILPLLGFLVAMAACVLNEETDLQPNPTLVDNSLSTYSGPPSDAAQARAELQPTAGSGVEGTVDFTRLSNGVRIVAFVRGLDDGRFALHIYDGRIHEGGSCARHGMHFNPSGASHGGPESVEGQRHAGDLGNIRSERGRARTTG